MTKIDILRGLSNEDIRTASDKFTSVSSYLKSLNISSNGRYGKIVNQKLNDLGLSWLKVEKWESRTCPTCLKEFNVRKTDKKVTCSYSCSNTYFRSGINNTWKNKGNGYRQICFSYHNKSCIVCGEENIVEVHHFDCNKSNNSPDNLIPLCPTHHQYIHSRYHNIIDGVVVNYKNNFGV